MSKLQFDFQVPDKYDKQTFSNIIRSICNQVNILSEGSLAARYQAQSAKPNNSAVSYAKGDIIWESNPTIVGSVSPGLAASYVRLGWVCTASGSALGTYQLSEIRTLIGS